MFVCCRVAADLQSLSSAGDSPLDSAGESPLPPPAQLDPSALPLPHPLTHNGTTDGEYSGLLTLALLPSSISHVLRRVVSGQKMGGGGGGDAAL